MDKKQMRFRSILFDALCLLVCIVVFYIGSNYALPLWALIIGLLAAVASLVLAVYYSIKSQRQQ